MNDKYNLFDDNDSSRRNSNKKEEFKTLTEKDHKQDFNSGSDLSDNNSTWKILIVDDEKDVVRKIKLALNDFEFNGKKLHFFEADSSEKAKKVLSENEDLALIFSDAATKPGYDGLELVKYIRDDLKNNLVHIVLRTEQTDDIPQKEIISKYRINFFQSKAELTEIKLYTIFGSILNSYNALKTADKSNKSLKSIVIKRTTELIQKNEELQKTLAAKNKMFSIIAHDLINPFNSLMGISELLKQSDKFDSEKIQTFADTIFQTSRNTYKLLSNLLEWSRSQMGQIQYKPGKVLLNDLIKNNILLLQSQADNKSISLKFSAEEDIYAYCDSNMINTVIRNLLSNGIKFTEKGEVKIAINKTDDACIIKVRDTGIGIRKEKIKNILAHDNISSPGTAGENGTGIGLMLCCEFIEKNNGKIWIESEVNKGSCFKISLPSFKS